MQQVEHCANRVFGGVQVKESIAAELHLAPVLYVYISPACDGNSRTPTNSATRSGCQPAPNPFGVTIFYDDQEQEFVVVTEDGDHLGSAKTMAEAKEIGENLGYAPHKSLKVPTHRKIKSRPGGSQKQGYVT
jgi:hypothetical protein